MAQTEANHIIGIRRQFATVKGSVHGAAFRGWSNFFTATAFLGLPVLLLIALAARSQRIMAAKVGADAPDPRAYTGH